MRWVLTILGIVMIMFGAIWFLQGVGALPGALALFVVVLVMMQYGVIFREERYLEGRFGAEYVRYKERVRRWS